MGPAVLVLEDMHRADPQTVEFAAYLLADPPPRLSLVLTFRGDAVPTEVRAVTARLPPTLTRTDIVLPPLTAEQTDGVAEEDQSLASGGLFNTSFQFGAAPAAHRWRGRRCGRRGPCSPQLVVGRPRPSAD